ncbi:hypothetical protein [Carnobacterium antarcticum]|uniref:DUF1310 domain-containing protein n=1 Tax=Carnobacterium antarcticum TaxID=2126436 RepID=A0ABW4NMK6_9LACT|nr:hypothetical protein [Carnobacterium sp. CP1]ALV20769.1 hypothetical protein NY10_144 [Carnobacterium sp. CP1]
MLDLRVYTINFEYTPEGEVSKVVVNFSTVNQGDNYINGNVALTAEEFNQGSTIEQVKAKLVKELAG